MDAIGSLIGGLGGFSFKFDWAGLMEKLNLSPVLQFLVNLIISLT